MPRKPGPGRGKKNTPAIILKKIKDNVTFEMIGRIYSVFGATDMEVAEVLGFDRSTLDSWQRTAPVLKEIKEAHKAESDNKVQRKLFERGCGYDYEEERALVVDGKIEVISLKKHAPPDPTSMIFWLKNRRPDEWRDVKDIRAQKKAQTELEIAMEALITEGKKEFGPDFLPIMKKLIGASKEAEKN